MFQICFDRMLRKYWNFSIPLNDAINVLHEIDPRAPKQHGYDFIHRLIDMSYFIKWPLSKDPNDYDVTIGCRGIREFEPLLLDMYKDVVRSCLLCQNIMIHVSIILILCYCFCPLKVLRLIFYLKNLCQGVHSVHTWRRRYKMKNC